MSARLIPLEDTWVDVIRKARMGLGLTEKELGRRSGLTDAQIKTLESGMLDPEKLVALAAALELHPGRLLAIACGEYHPGAILLPEGMAMFSAPWHDFEVHSYLVWDVPSTNGVETSGGFREKRAAAVFDCGPDATEMMDFVAHHNLSLGQVFLTHGHGDHVFDLERVTEKTGSAAWIGINETLEGVNRFEPGREFFIGSLRVETRSTRGHSPGGVTFLIHGLEKPVAIVGDALFAGSMGSPFESYQFCLADNWREIFSLPLETILCPGHGPLTTVALEQNNNPFFGNAS